MPVRSQFRAVGVVWAALVLLCAAGQGAAQQSAAANPALKILVLPFRNESERAEFDHVGYSAWVTLVEQLGEVRGVEVVGGSELRKVSEKLKLLRSAIPENRLAAAGSAVGARMVLGGKFGVTEKGELEIVGLVVEVQTRKVTRLKPVVCAPRELGQAEVKLAQAMISQALRGKPLRAARPRGLARAARPEAQLLAASAARMADQGDLALVREEIDAANKFYDDAARAVGDALAAEEGAALVDALEAVCRDILAANPNHVGAIVDLGLIHCRRGDYSRAVHAYLRALEISPNEPVIYYHLGLAYRKQGKTEQAIEAYRKAISLDEKFALAYNDLAVLYEELGEYDRAIELYRRAVEVGEKSEAAALAGTNLGVALIRKGDLEGAVEALSAALAVKPGLADALYDRGVAFQQLGQLAEAERDYRAALEAGGRLPRVYSNLGVVLFLQDRYQEALEQYQEALKLDPNFASAHRNLAIVYEKLASEAESGTGGTENAAEYWRKAHESWQKYLRGKDLSGADRALARRHIEWIEKYKLGQ